MSRDVPGDIRAGLEDTGSPDAILGFLTVWHSVLSEPIRVVSDVMDYDWGGHRWAGVPFDIRLLSDDDAAPQTQLRMQNVDRRIGEALRAVTDRARIRLDVASSADFDLSADPRVPLGEVRPIYSFAAYELVQVEVNAVEITGRVMLRDFAQEPWPGLVTTQSRAPGLYR